VRKLVGVPAAALALVRQRTLKVLAAPEQHQVAKLLAELDDEAFAVRERASSELAKRAKALEPVLRQARTNAASPEVRRRLDALLGALPSPPRANREPSPEQLRLVRAVVVLGRIDTAEARAILAELANQSALREALAEPAIRLPYAQEVKGYLARLGQPRGGKP
jgi:hypothetical protein